MRWWRGIPEKGREEQEENGGERQMGYEGESKGRKTIDGKP